MATFRLEVNVDNAAFDGPKLYSELARILRATAEKIDCREKTAVILFDINGNRVGGCFIEGEVEYLYRELASILRARAEKIDCRHATVAVLFDINGNRVGQCFIEGEVE